MSVLKITGGNFEDEAVVTHKPVLLELWASWYTPCRFVSPIIEEIEAEYGDVIKVGRVDLDRQRELRELFEVETLPMIVLLTGGVIDKKIIGKVPTKQEIITEFELEKHKRKAEESWLKKK